jgi:hypothetical protein
VQPDALPLGERELALAVPNGVRHAHAPEIVKVGRAAKIGDVGRGQALLQGGPLDETRDALRVSERVDRLEIREKTERSRDVVEAVLACGGRGLRFSGEKPLPEGILEVVEKLVGGAEEDARQLRVEVGSGSAARNRSQRESSRWSRSSSAEPRKTRAS